MLAFGGLGDTILDDGAAYNPEQDTWRKLPDAPIGGVADHAMVWTGEQMVVFGGRISATNNVYTASGAEYLPKAAIWREIPKSPLSPRQDPAIVWTGEEVIIWGGVGGDGWLADGAAYSPATRSWRTIAPSPLDPRQAPLMVWTGGQVLVVGGTANVEQFAVGAAAYNPDNDSWSEISGPVDTSWGVGAWTSELLIDYGGLAVFDGRSWGELAAPPPSIGSVPTATWTGNELILLGGEAHPETPTDAAFSLEYRKR